MIRFKNDDSSFRYFTYSTHNLLHHPLDGLMMYLREKGRVDGARATCSMLVQELSDCSVQPDTGALKGRIERMQKWLCKPLYRL